MERPKTIGVNNGFLTADGKLLLQIRTNNSWMGRVLGKCYKGLWELNGGMVQEKDILKALTLPVLKAQAIENAKKKLGIIMTVPEKPEMYLTIYENKDKGILDWAITFPIPPKCWQMPEELSRDIMLVDVEGLNNLANRPEGKGQLVSGWGKRQHRTGLGTLFHGLISQRLQAEALLTRIKPDWRETEYSDNAEEFLARLRKAIS